jgi:hypothetical protein
MCLMLCMLCAQVEGDTKDCLRLMCLMLCMLCAQVEGDTKDCLRLMCLMLCMLCAQVEGDMKDCLLLMFQARNDSTLLCVLDGITAIYPPWVVHAQTWLLQAAQRVEGSLRSLALEILRCIVCEGPHDDSSLGGPQVHSM